MSADAPDLPEPPRYTREVVYQRAWASEHLGALAGDLAHPSAVFFAALRAEGLSAEDAAALTSAFLRVLLGRDGAPDPP